MRSEWVVVVLGLVVGYCLVSYLMSRGKATGAAAQPPPDPWQGSAWSDAGRGADAATPAWHEVLGVPASASREQVERAYRQRISQYHPDKVASLGEDIRRLAETRAKEINAAYDEGVRGLPR